MQKTTVAIVEDDEGVRTQLSRLVDLEADLKCIGAFDTGEEALREIPGLRPDVVLMDMNLPGISGIECVGELKKIVPWVQIIMLTIYEDSDRLFAALKSGANGYLLKYTLPETLISAIRDVQAGGSPMSPHIARRVLEQFQSGVTAPVVDSKLSRREDEILRLLADGLIYKEIGNMLGIAPETVRGHIKNACKKMDVRNRVEAVAKRRLTITR